jgi:hypothetical protein
MDKAESNMNASPVCQYESSAANTRRLARRSVSICSWITLTLFILGSCNLFPDEVNIAISYLGLGLLIGSGTPLLLLSRLSKSR